MEIRKIKQAGLIVAIGFLASCGGKGNTESDSDSASVVVADENVINEEVKNFSSPDLSFCGLHSNISRVVEQIYAATKSDGVFKKGELVMTDTLYFDESGRLVKHALVTHGDYRSITKMTFEYSPEGVLLKGIEERKDANESYKMELKVKRDSEGYITELSGRGKYEDRDYVDTYTWKDGRKVSFHDSGWEWGTQEDYTYNEQGFISKYTSVFDDMGYRSKTTTTIEYPNVDKYGNWTESQISSATEEGETNELSGKTDYGKAEFDYKIKERTIDYRE